jgi:hypothetical protein
MSSCFSGATFGFIGRPRHPRDFASKHVKSSRERIDSGGMSTTTNNELICVIDAERAKGCSVKSIRKQKHDPCNFYMTCTDGQQVGPVKCEGNTDELNRKFGEAQSYLAGMKNNPAKQRVTAA